LVGSWPQDLDWQDPEYLGRFRERALAWQLKSLHEAKLRSSWADPDKSYEDASAGFVRRLLDPGYPRGFLRDLSAFVERIAPAAALNGLVQTTLRCTVPGVPDLYQGAEFWDLSLVDPDNRRPVDFVARVTALGRDTNSRKSLGNWRTGEIKQYVIGQLLALRNRLAGCFLSGDYQPLEPTGLRARNIAGFARRHGEADIVVVVPRRCAGACIAEGLPLPGRDFWGDTTVLLPDDFHGRTLYSLFDPETRIVASRARCTDMFRRFPVAVLLSA
jgi:(1->4)-alpha-D-glucan 1-alpha-D-glucosylmutase